MMELLWKAFGAGLLCSVAVLILKPMKGELSWLARIGGGILILIGVLPFLADTVEDVVALFEGTDMGKYANVMLRAIGIALLTRICTDVCRDTGEGMVASGVELAGKVAILSLCLPMIQEIIGYAARILQESEG